MNDIRVLIIDLDNYIEFHVIDVINNKFLKTYSMIERESKMIIKKINTIINTHNINKIIIDEKDAKQLFKER